MCRPISTVPLAIPDGLKPVLLVWLMLRLLAVPQRILRIQQEGIAFARQHPLAVGGVILALVVLRPRFVLRWTGRAVAAWRTWRTVSGLVPGFVWNRLRPRR